MTSNLRFDLPASLVVFLVAVPLSLGIAVASNAPVASGLIAAVVGGIIGGLFGGTPLQVSGPAAGLAVITAGLVEQFGWQVTCAITVLAGLVQLALGVGRVGRVVLAISPAIVHGMLAGIGVTIALGQLHVLLGGEPDTTPIQNILQLPAQLLALHDHAAFIGLFVVVLLVIWPRLPRPISVVPGPLVAITLATVLAVFWASDAPRVRMPASVLDAVRLPSLPDEQWMAFGVGVFTVAVVASIESLLSATAVDKLHRGRRADLDRELSGQGMANTASGLLGGLPITGVIVRSSTNVAAGARTRASAVLHGIWIAVFGLLLVSLVERIPMAALAGLLVVVGVQLVKISHIRDLRRHGELPVYLATAIGVVALNLLEGVLVGLGVALLLMIRRVVRANVRSEQVASTLGSGSVSGPDSGPASGPPSWRVTVEGTVGFLSLPRLSTVLGRVPTGARVELDLVADFLDHAAFEYLESWIRQHEATGGSVLIDEVGVASLRADGSGPPRRAGAAAALPRWFAPWSVWQARRTTSRVPSQRTPEAAADAEAGAAPPESANGSVARPAPSPVSDTDPDSGSSVWTPFVTGVREYHRRSAPLLRQVYADLGTVHEPSVLFLTCADARVVPNLITSSGPGDLFTVRNIGNLVPSSVAEPSESHPMDSSVAASVEFAVEKLRVPVAIVCGHSMCGAMNGLLTGAAEDDSMLGRWLRAGVPSLRAWREGHPVGVTAAEQGRGEVDQLAMVNVMLQVQALRTTAPVARAAIERGMSVQGMFFDIATGTVMILDEALPGFRPVTAGDDEPDLLADPA